MLDVPEAGLGTVKRMLVVVRSGVGHTATTVVLASTVAMRKAPAMAPLGKAATCCTGKVRSPAPVPNVEVGGEPPITALALDQIFTKDQGSLVTGSTVAAAIPPAGSAASHCTAPAATSDHAPFGGRGSSLETSWVVCGLALYGQVSRRPRCPPFARIELDLPATERVQTCTRTQIQRLDIIFKCRPKNHMPS